MATAPRLLRNALLLLAVVLALLHAGELVTWRFVNQLELAIDDARTRAFLPHTRDTRIVIVDVDEASLARIGRWPWPRARLAALVDELFERQRIALLGFDMVFAEPDADDARLAAALAGRPVVLGYYLGTEQGAGRVGVLPAPAFDAAALGGRQVVFLHGHGYAGNVETLARAAPAAGYFNDARADADGVIRTVSLIAELDGRHYDTLALAMLRRYAGEPTVRPIAPPPRSFDRHDRLAAIALEQGATRMTYPVDRHVAARVPFLGAPGPHGGSFDYVSAADLLEGRLEAGTLAKKLVLFGTTAPGLFDLRSTPVANVYPGVEVHASLLSGLLDRRIGGAPDWADTFEVVQLLAVVALLGLALPRLRAAAGIVTTLALAAALVALNLWLVRVHALVLPLASALLLLAAVYAITTGWGYVVEGHSRRSLARLFGSYVPPELVAQMARDPQRYTMQAENRVLTVMFCDMRNFTQISETLPPEELRALVNRFFSAMTLAIRAHRGTLDKYIGDAIMAFWGAPVDDPDHALHAVRAAQDMCARLEPLNAELRARGLPALGLGIGINSGLVCVGDMGSDLRRSYTVMGDAVNLAARIEALTRLYDVDVLIGQGSAELLGGRVALLEVDRVRVKGKQQAVTLFTPLPASVPSDDEVRLWQLALTAYRGQDAPQALASLEVLRERFGSSPLSGLYRQLGERVASWARHPEPTDWDGTRTFDSK